MPRKAQPSYPAQLWYDARCVLGGSRARNQLYCKHDAHVRVWKHWAPLRLYQPKYDHEAHVAAFEKRIKAKIRRMTVRKDECLLWVGRMFNNTPRLNVDYRNEQHPIALHQRLTNGLHLPPGHLWSRATCNHKDCIVHRVPISTSELKRQIANDVKHRASYIASRVRSGLASSSFTEDQVLEMRRLRGDGMTYKEISLQLGGINVQSVRYIVTGKRWKHVGQQANALAFMASQLTGARQ